MLPNFFIYNFKDLNFLLVGLFATKTSKYVLNYVIRHKINLTHLSVHMITLQVFKINTTELPACYIQKHFQLLMNRTF